MRFWEICFIIFVLLAIFTIICTVVYLYTMYQLETCHYYGWLSDEIYNELVYQKNKTFKERKEWYAQTKEAIHLAKTSNKKT